eukprot:CAMPEP_0172797670 /NCGR_PEP_ID=MMETSP1075-20121228/581_1 /TAXON_ID=2916 /ORGANISM="Ceratium fusus, Strain PA161109" /LENGTH=222 /DNA_ID=CAMNT_0013634959 /DNA_START=74 /DNA_END=742 /DNA_ORIENTATION=+
MDSTEAQKQIEQMTSFILSEATDKANDIAKKGEEEFSIEVHRLITEQKEKIRQGYERKAKQIETQYAIAKSMAINKQRLEKIKARQDVMGNISEDVKGELAKAIQASNSKDYITKLIVQGLLMLLETEVGVRCRKCDKQLVNDCLQAASDQYSEIIKTQTGATKTCKLTINEQDFLPESCLGGVALSCFGGKITIDNTMDLRLQLVMDQAKPAIRGLLFPTK